MAVKLVGFGGFQEIGKSTLMIEDEENIVIIDSGIKFAESSVTGVKGVVPSYNYLKNNINKVRALIITHGHEDHIGGVPYLVNAIKLPTIIAPRIAIKYLKLKFNEFRIKHLPEFIEIEKDLVINYGNMKIDFWTAQHSIPDAFGIRVKTKDGSIMCTGDFRFDYTPIGNLTDFTKLEQIGKDGLTVLLSDSTNAMRPMHSPSESDILFDIRKLIESGTKKIIITAFASNLTRITAIIKLANELNKKVITFGRSMVNAIEIGKKLGYLEGAEAAIIDKKNYSNFDSNELLILTTGSQGEPQAALARMAQKKHPQVKIENGDLIIFSSSPIPGNVMKIEELVNKLYKLGAIIKENRIDGYLHTSGHAYQEEHEKIFSLTKPKYFIPYHGEFRMEIAHSNTAIKSGVAEENIIIPKIGEVVIMENQKLLLSKENLNIDSVFIDGETILPYDKDLFIKRTMLGEAGFVNIVVLIDKKNNTLFYKPKVISRGCFYTKTSAGIIEETKRMVQGAINWLINNNKNYTVQDVKNIIQTRIEPFFYKIKRRRPVIMSTVLFVDDENIKKNKNNKPFKNSNSTNNEASDKKPKNKQNFKPKTQNKKSELIK